MAVRVSGNLRVRESDWESLCERARIGLGVAPNGEGPEGEGEASVASGRKRKGKEGDRKRVRGPGRVRGRGERKSAFNARFNEERERKKKGWDLV
jgi:hypothetical protein